MRQHGWVLLASAVLYLAVRLPALGAHGLWVDEAFSLAMATGHSLEHPAELADQEKGDYVQQPRPMPASRYADYLRHDSPPAGMGRVLRAVELSDTSPPLYYLLLHRWTLLAGTSDRALRGFSALWGLLCLPFLLALAVDFAGRHSVLPGLLLFTLAPISVYYTTEGRMYSLLIFLAAVLVWLTRRVDRSEAWALMWPGWVVAAAAGLLTHYFFAFVLAASVAWLLWGSAPGRRWRVITACGVVLLAVLPWYLQLPTSAEQWRVTSGWLDLAPATGTAIRAALFMIAGLVSIRGTWEVPDAAFVVDGLIYVALAGIVLAGHRTWLFREQRRLLWLWLVGPALGVILVGWVSGSYLSWNIRYGLAALPAAQLLVGACISRLSVGWRTLFTILIVTSSIFGLYHAFRSARMSQPFEAAARELQSAMDPGEAVVVQSIPSGVALLSRYLDEQGAEVRVVSWVDRLEGHRRGDPPILSAGRPRLFFVRVHAIHGTDELENELRRRGRLSLIDQLGAIEIYRLVPGRP